MPAKGDDVVPRALTIATSDSGGGAGIQADLKAFAAAGCHGMSAIVALTAQNTAARHGRPRAAAGVRRRRSSTRSSTTSASTRRRPGCCSRARMIETVADFLEAHPRAARRRSRDGRELRREAARRTMRSTCSSTRLFPLATVVTPNLPEAQALAGLDVEDPARARRAAASSWARRAVLVTGGHGEEPVDHLFDGERRTSRSRCRATTRRATHGAGCTHSATLAGAARPRRGPARRRARVAAAAASRRRRARPHRARRRRGPGRRLPRDEEAMSDAPERRCATCASAGRSSTRSRTTSS